MFRRCQIPFRVSLELDMMFGEDEIEYDDPENAWKRPEFRKHVVKKLNEEIARSHYPMMQGASEMENLIFEASESKMDYLDFMARLIPRVRQFGGFHSYSTDLPSLKDMKQDLVDPLNDIATLRRLRRRKDYACGHSSYCGLVSIKDFPVPSLSSGSILGPFGRSKEGEKYARNNVWQTASFRKFVFRQIVAVLLRHGTPSTKTVINMEIQIFVKSKSYADYVAYLDILLKELKSGSRVYNYGPSKLEDLPEPVVAALRVLHKEGMSRDFSPPPLTSWYSKGQNVIGA